VASKSAKKKSPPPARPLPPRPSLATQPEQTGRIVASWLFPAYLIVIFIGYLLMHSSLSMNHGNEMGAGQALFTSINAATLTGFPQSYDLNQFQPVGQSTVFALMLCGSMLTMIIGALAAVRVLKLPYGDWRIVKAAAAVHAGAIVAGALVLLVDPQRTIPQAIFTSTSAFSNCGLVLGQLPSIVSWLTPVLLMPLITLGGLGLPVLMELYDAFTHRRKISLHSRSVLLTTGWLFVIGTLLLVLLRSLSSQSGGWRYLLTSSAAMTVNARTAGFAFFFLPRNQPLVGWALILFMTLGGASAGTAGGIKINTFCEIARQLSRAANGKPLSRSLWIASAWIALYAAIVAITLVLLLKFQADLHPDESVLKAFSAVSNCGLCFHAIEKKNFSQYYILSAAMLAGRFCGLSILWWLADTTPDADIAVG